MSCQKYTWLKIFRNRILYWLALKYLFFFLRILRIRNIFLNVFGVWILNRIYQYFYSIIEYICVFYTQRFRDKITTILWWGQGIGQPQNIDLFFMNNCSIYKMSDLRFMGVYYLNVMIVIHISFAKQYHFTYTAHTLLFFY